MKGWIILALLAGALYYLYTETDKLDVPIAKTEAMIKEIENKVDSMTGTKIIKIDHKLAKVRTDIIERLSTLELEAFNQIPMTPESIADFKANYCGTMAPQHPVFSKDNQLYLCDHL
ncbi:hypothetical protein L5M43_22750 [Shewanella sp. SW36]|jgi:hypothetical protein|uniref:hypothetical protein n=1 Tax=Shewanella TaxID=22 RepID=UPI000DEB7BE5|nr:MULTISPECIES: hypothetical protein [unclassified Shewanella]RBP75818.1 hypothetical protein DET47_12169 [Shewanella putrefaciens]MCU7978031.1 hypothetical protein [Shewanella sp. SW36]MCU7993273.1 hypothetical protein [Shewanella sp. SW1]MCU8005016.1 hypothetical protein [Shewanella sp. SM96]MCU8014710.1 hypothetical protein [Shewanella sp. SM74]